MTRQQAFDRLSRIQRLLAWHLSGPRSYRVFVLLNKQFARMENQGHMPRIHKLATGKVI